MVTPGNRIGGATDMPDILSSAEVSLPSYYLRVKTKYGEVFKRENGLISKNEKDALLEIKERFDGVNTTDSWEKYYLVKRYWILPIHKGSDMEIEEAQLEIKKAENCNWTVRRVSDFLKTPL